MIDLHQRKTDGCFVLRVVPEDCAKRIPELTSRRLQCHTRFWRATSSDGQAQSPIANWNPACYRRNVVERTPANIV